MVRRSLRVDGVVLCFTSVLYFTSLPAVTD